MKLEVIKAKALTWYNITAMDHDGIHYLKENFDFHDLDIEDVLSKNQRSKMDYYDEYIFLVLHFPIFNQFSERIEIVELNMFVGKDYVVTIHDNRLKTLKDLYEECSDDDNNEKEEIMSSAGRLLYEILNTTYQSSFPLIDRVGWEITEIERELFEEGDTDDIKDRLKDIMLVKRNIMRFRRIIQPARVVVMQLENKKLKFISTHYDIYFDDILDTIEKTWETLESYKEIVNTLHETNEALINHRTNNIMKILTVFSVILLPITFITGLYGMNLRRLPLDQSPYGFEFILLGMFVLVLIMLWYFSKKRWL